MNPDDIEREAMRMFRVVSGHGTNASDYFLAQNPATLEGWMQLARESLKMQITRAVFTPLKQRLAKQDLSQTAIEAAESYLKEIDGDDFKDPDHGHNVTELAVIVQIAINKEVAKRKRNEQHRPPRHH